MISALFVSTAFAAAPVVETSAVPANSESLINTNGFNNINEEKAVVDAPEAADVSGKQDVED